MWLAKPETSNWVLQRASITELIFLPRIVFLKFFFTSIGIAIRKTNFVWGTKMESTYSTHSPCYNVICDFSCSSVSFMNLVFLCLVHKSLGLQYPLGIFFPLMSIQCSALILLISFHLKSDIKMAASGCWLVPFVWNIFSHPFTLK